MLTTGKTSTPLFWIPLFQSLYHTEHINNLFQEASPQNAWKDRFWWHQHLPPRSPCLPPWWCTFCLHWDRNWQPSFFSWFLLVASTSELSCHKKCSILHRQRALLRLCSPWWSLSAEREPAGSDTERPSHSSRASLPEGRRAPWALSLWFWFACFGVWFWFFFFFFGQCHAACGILVPRPGIKPLHGKLWVLTTGQPGKSLYSLLLWVLLC